MKPHRQHDVCENEDGAPEWSEQPVAAAELIKQFYRSIPVIHDESHDDNEWTMSFLRMFDSANDSALFRTFTDLEDAGFHQEITTSSSNDEVYVPLYESKLANQFTHRAGTFDGTDPEGMFRTRAATRSPSVIELSDAGFEALPRYWVLRSEVQRRCESHTSHNWLMGFRRTISAVADSRSATFFALPKCGTTDSIFLFFTERPVTDNVVLLALGNSFVFDYVTRQKASGGNLSYYVVKQLPVPSPSSLPSWMAIVVLSRVVELTYTTWLMQPLACDCGYDGPPFRWDEERRFQIRCELDAAFFHLYLGSEEEWGAENQQLREMFPTPRNAVDYIMDTFPIVRRKDEAKYDGDYRTKRTILEIYDQMAEAIRTGQPYQTSLDPPPGPPTNEEGNFIPYSDWTDAIREQYASVIHIPAHDGDDVVDEGILPEVSYPGVAAFDRSVCAAALRVVDQAPGIESPEHLDLLLLASQPEFCEPFLDESDAAQLSQFKQSDAFPFRAETGTSIRWKECRDYLELRQALVVDHDTTRQPIHKGSRFAAVLNEFDSEVEELLNLAFKAMEVIRSLRGDLTQASVVQRRVIEKLDKFREQYDLAA